MDGSKTFGSCSSEGQDTIKIGNYETRKSYAAALTSGADQKKRVGDLSGAKRNRFATCSLLKEAATLLLARTNY